jgi:hypothetical protein
MTNCCEPYEERNSTSYHVISLGWDESGGINQANLLRQGGQTAPR